VRESMPILLLAAAVLTAGSEGIGSWVASFRAEARSAVSAPDVPSTAIEAAPAPEPTPSEPSADTGPYFSYEPFTAVHASDGRLIPLGNSRALSAVLPDFAWPPAPTRVRLELNDGEGHFTDATDTFLGDVRNVHPRAFAVADFTGDGRSDFFIADHGSDLAPYPGGQSRLLVQTADGRLVDETAARLPPGVAFTHGVAAGDIDDDGDVDVYMCNIWGAGQVGPRFYVNDGTGHFTADTTRIPEAISNLSERYTACAFADVDGDGDLDLVLGGHPGMGPSAPARDLALLNDGAGSFTRAPAEMMPPRYGGPTWGAVAISVSDFDGDGWEDLLMVLVDANYGATRLQLLLHTPGGYVDASANIPQAWPTTGCDQPWVKWALPADVNNDGWMDFATTGNCIGPHLFLNAGNGVFVDRTDILPPNGAGGGLSAYTSSMLPGDLDSDGDVDILAVNPGPDAFAVLRNLQQLSVANSCGYTLTPDRTFVAAAGSAVTVHMQTGTACEWSLQTNESWIHLPSGTSGAGPASVLLQVDANRGAARMGVVSVAGRRVVVRQGALHVPVDDLSGDLRSDILWRHTTRGDVWLWPMDGAVRMTETRVETVADTNFGVRGQGDQNGDGKADILWRNKATGAIYYWPMNGSTPLAETYLATVDPAYDIVGTGDYDGDGKSDILWRHLTNGELWVWLMDGATKLSATFVATVDPGYAVVGSGDVNGDSKASIVWRHKTNGDVWMWLMNGATPTAMTYVTTVSEPGYQIVGVADHTGDGRADILWHHSTRGEVWLWPMNGTTVVRQAYVGMVPDTGYRVVGSGDYNGDGKADLLWHHATRGEVWVWLMDGTTKLSENYVGIVPDVGYQIVKVK